MSSYLQRCVKSLPLDRSHPDTDHFRSCGKICRSSLKPPWTFHLRKPSSASWAFRASFTITAWRIKMTRKQASFKNISNFWTMRGWLCFRNSTAWRMLYGHSTFYEMVTSWRPMNSTFPMPWIVPCKQDYRKVLVAKNLEIICACTFWPFIIFRYTWSYERSLYILYAHRTLQLLLNFEYSLFPLSSLFLSHFQWRVQTEMTCWK